MEPSKYVLESIVVHSLVIKGHLSNVGTCGQCQGMSTQGCQEFLQKSPWVSSSSQASTWQPNSCVGSLPHNSGDTERQGWDTFGEQSLAHVSDCADCDSCNLKEIRFYFFILERQRKHGWKEGWGGADGEGETIPSRCCAEIMT